jgi:hypothetical protein
MTGGEPPSSSRGTPAETVSCAGKIPTIKPNNQPWKKMKHRYNPLNRVPFLNVVFGMFCTIPSFEGLEKMLQIFALIDALMLA